MDLITREEFEDLLGAFALDLAWFLSGLAFWWPVVIDMPIRGHFGPPMRMLYLFAGTQAHLYLSMWLLLAEFPAYSIFELAPRVTGLSALEDQQVAGGPLPKIGGTYVLPRNSVAFLRWVAGPPHTTAEFRNRTGWPFVHD